MPVRTHLRDFEEANHLHDQASTRAGWYVAPTLTGGRILLALEALVFGAFGALYWVIPVQMAAKVGVTMTNPAGIVDVQGLYGGLEVGLAVFLAWCAIRDVRIGLAAGACALGGIALSRFVAIAHFGLPDAGVTALVVLDLVGALLSVGFWWRYREKA